MSATFAGGWFNGSWQDAYEHQVAFIRGISSDEEGADRLPLWGDWYAVTLSTRSTLSWVAPQTAPSLATVSVLRLHVDADKLNATPPFAERWRDFMLGHRRKPVYLYHEGLDDDGTTRLIKYDGYMISSIYGLFRGFNRDVEEFAPEIVAMPSGRVGFREEA